VVFGLIPNQITGCCRLLSELFSAVIMRTGAGSQRVKALTVEEPKMPGVD